MVIRYNNKVRFSEVDNGTVIKHKDSIYLKFDRVDTNDSCRYNVVNLESGRLDFIDDLCFVTPLNCELVIN